MDKIFGEVSWSFILGVIVSIGLLIGIIDISKKVDRIEELEHLLSETQVQTSKTLEEVNERLNKIEKRVLTRKERATNISAKYTNEVLRYTSLDVFCLAKNMYHEAKGEGDIGMYAVAQVTINRLHTKRWGSTVCDVVMSPSQFSWANDKSIRWKHPRGEMWERSREIAEQVLSKGLRVPKLENALFYHATYVNPRWASDKYYIAQIGLHIFYHNAL
jgi:spore germination cell wall hydrolase CwlJ-like protein